MINLNLTRIFNIVPLADLLHSDTEADRDAGEDVAADDRVDDVLAVVHIGTFRVLLLLPIAVAVVAADAAGDGAEFFFAECHLSSFFFFTIFPILAFTGSL